MSEDKKAIVWGTEDCPMCVEATEKLLRKGYSVEKQSVDDLMSGAVANIDVMAQLASQNMTLPVIQIGDTFILLGDLDNE